MKKLKTVRRFLKMEFWITVVWKLYRMTPLRFRELSLIDKTARIIFDRRFLTDISYRTRMLLLPCLFVNFLYAAMHLVLGVCYRSIWSGALAVYYALLAVMRVLLLKPAKHNVKKEMLLTELRRYRLCGILLLCMTPVFASIMILVIHKNSGAKYPGFTVAIMAVYTIGIVVISVFNLVRFRKEKSPAMSAAKIVSLVAALMSVLSLTTALAGRIGNGNSNSIKRGIIGTTSGSFCVIVLCIAIYMLVYASKQFKVLVKK